jgi:hypothetical protein
MGLHPAIQDELNMLRERFPGKPELTLDDYADYFGISRHYASQHFNRMNKGRVKIGHKRFGRDIIIPLLDFAHWLARHKVMDGRQIDLPQLKETSESEKRRRGFGAYTYSQYG